MASARRAGMGARKLLVGAVRYLNTKPLVYGLERLAPGVQLVYDVPSRLSDDLAAGRLDVALIPAIEFFRGAGYSIVSDACIACRGPVLSVKLYCRKPFDDIRTLALDDGSRTSAALVRILLKERFGLEPRLERLPVEASIDATEADAVLLIGDRAMHASPGKFAAVWDLGDEWNRWAQLPFVFAMWTARPGVEVAELDIALRAARDAGLANLEAIAEREAASLGLTRPQCVAYLRDNLHFYLGDHEQRGLELFYERAVSMGLAPAGVNLGCSNSTHSG